MTPTLFSESLLSKVDTDKVGFFRMRRLGAKILITNDVGEYAMLTPKDFEKFVSGKLKAENKLHKELREKGFIRDFADFESLVGTWRQTHTHLFQGPALHIIVVTLRCDHRCTYCQTSSVPMKSPQSFDMTKETAKKVVDVIFQTTNPAVTIEFQGGEPLVNYPIIQFVVDYALEKNEVAKKTLFLNLVTNMTYMDDEKLKWLLEKKVNLCTSLDGPADLHDKNRIHTEGSGHANVVKWWKKIKKLTKGKTYGIDALMTTTRASLKRPKDIIDEYIRLGARGIYLRSLAPYGMADRTWKAIGYGADEWLEFFKTSLDYIIELNMNKKRFFEQTTRIYATKILRRTDPNFMDLRSPCGAGIGQVAYNFDGKVYTCDEGRMLSRMGDEMFRIGDAATDNFAAIVAHPTVRACATASTLENQPECSSCAYLPYCGVCPVDNYHERKDLFAMTPTSGWCRIHKGTQDYIFKRMEEPAVKKIFLDWTRTPTMLRKRD